MGLDMGRRSGRLGPPPPPLTPSTLSHIHREVHARTPRPQPQEPRRPRPVSFWAGTQTWALEPAACWRAGRTEPTSLLRGEAAPSEDAPLWGRRKGLWEAGEEAVPGSESA